MFFLSMCLKKYAVSEAILSGRFPKFGEEDEAPDRLEEWLAQRGIP